MDGTEERGENITQVKRKVEGEKRQTRERSK